MSSGCAKMGSPPCCPTRTPGGSSLACSVNRDTGKDRTIQVRQHWPLILLPSVQPHFPTCHPEQGSRPQKPSLAIWKTGPATGAATQLTVRMNEDGDAGDEVPADSMGSRRWYSVVLLTHALGPGEPACTQLPLFGAPPSSYCGACILQAQARCHLLPEAHPSHHNLSLGDAHSRKVTAVSYSSCSWDALRIRTISPCLLSSPTEAITGLGSPSRGTGGRSKTEQYSASPTPVRRNQDGGDGVGGTQGGAG